MVREELLHRSNSCKNYSTHRKSVGRLSCTYFQGPLGGTPKNAPTPIAITPYKTCAVHTRYIPRQSPYCFPISYRGHHQRSLLKLCFFRGKGGRQGRHLLHLNWVHLNPKPPKPSHVARSANLGFLYPLLPLMTTMLMDSTAERL